MRDLDSSLYDDKSFEELKGTFGFKPIRCTKLPSKVGIRQQEVLKNREDDRGLKNESTSWWGYFIVFQGVVLTIVTQMM